MKEVNANDTSYDVYLEVEESKFFLYKFFNTLEEAKPVFELLKQFIPEPESPTTIFLVRYDREGSGFKKTVIKTYKLRDQEGKIVKLTKKERQGLLKERYEELRERLSSRK
ncbi:hypothetical protein [Microscilla marina]|uniref:Uncharacterized protein n=1 Tax=Microscilla marina ATCC 23134 TaxID=313606 RepID=A1ZU91_MICM2|nr:hypothetical protein [Microscilla marina]EAY26062.1 hypothetical protein M23134_06411 [Microscilla marina ATCC 23134]